MLEGDLLDALCAEPAIDAYCRRSNDIAMTVVGAGVEIFVGHPSVSGILYLGPGKRPEGFDRVIAVPAAPAAATPAERIVRAADALSVQPERRRPQIHLTGADRIRAERFAVGRKDRPLVALCLDEAKNNSPDRRQRWETVCRWLEQQWNAAIILLSGDGGALRVHKNLVGRLMPRETAAVLACCTAWLGDDPPCAALAAAVSAPGVFITNTTDFEADAAIVVCPADAAEQHICDALARLQPGEIQLNTAP